MQIGVVYISITLVVFLLFFCGIGLCFAKLFGLKDCDAELTLSAFWVGWSFVLISLQLWHLFAPVDIKAFLIFALVSILCLICNRTRIIDIRRTDLISKLIFLLILCLIVLFIASKAIGPIIVSDSGLYHIPSMRWISSYPIIPGLGNLHGRLAFNSSFILFLSLLDVSYWTHKSQHLANGLLFFVILCQLSFSGYKIIRGNHVINIYDIMRIIFIFPIIILCELFVSSPTPDIPVFLLGTVGCIQLCRLLYVDDNYPKMAFNVFLIITVSVVGVTIKTSFLFLGCLLSIVAFGKFLAFTGDGQHLNKNKLCGYFLATVLITLLPWITRNIILSGYFIYPSTFGSINVEWKIPYQHVLNEAQWIYSWARQPHITPDKVIANWDWFLPWTKRLITDRYTLVMVIAPLLMFIVAVIIKINSKLRIAEYYQYILLILPAILSLCFMVFYCSRPKVCGGIILVSWCRSISS